MSRKSCSTDQDTAQGAPGGLGALLYLDGDGNPFDDILGMAGKLML